VDRLFEILLIFINSNGALATKEKHGFRLKVLIWLKPGDGDDLFYRPAKAGRN
jgi:hypothetical protein